MSNAISMRTLTNAHAALVLAKAALEALPREHYPAAVWHAVMAAEQDLAIDLSILPPVEVKPTP